METNQYGVFVWTRVLTPEEIKNHYETGIAPKDSYEVEDKFWNIVENLFYIFNFCWDRLSRLLKHKQ